MKKKTLAVEHCFEDMTQEDVKKMCESMIDILNMFIKKMRKSEIIRP